MRSVNWRMAEDGTKEVGRCQAMCGFGNYDERFAMRTHLKGLEPEWHDQACRAEGFLGCHGEDDQP